MVELLIARCPNCSAALRLPHGATRVECGYCAVTSVVKGVGGAGTAATFSAPELRFEPPPPLVYTGAKSPLPAGCWYVTGVVALALGVSAFVLFENSYGALVLAVFGLLPFFLARSLQTDQRDHAAAAAELERFRREAAPGRATVDAIRAGDGRSARLSLQVEVAGAAKRNVEHTATIPELLVPRLAQGLTLPVIVEGDRIEVQWHLV